MPMSDYMRNIRSKIGTELLEIPSVTVLNFDERDRVLLVYHADVQLWTTPGGAVEPHETPANAAVREMWEKRESWSSCRACWASTEAPSTRRPTPTATWSRF